MRSGPAKQAEQVADREQREIRGGTSRDKVRVKCKQGDKQEDKGEWETRRDKARTSKRKQGNKAGPNRESAQARKTELAGGTVGTRGSSWEDNGNQEGRQAVTRSGARRGTRGTNGKTRGTRGKAITRAEPASAAEKGPSQQARGASKRKRGIEGGQSGRQRATRRSKQAGTQEAKPRSESCAKEATGVKRQAGKQRRWPASGGSSLFDLAARRQVLARDAARRHPRP